MNVLRLSILILVYLLTVQANGVRWLVLDLHSFHVTQSCLSDICRNPTFKSTLKVGDTLISSTIQINATSTNGIYDRLVSAPIKLTHLDTISVNADIVGSDVTFNFPRICDGSPLEPISKLINHTIHDKDSVDFFVQSKCFNANFKISVHLKTCPWCVVILDQSSVTSEEENNVSIFSSSTFLIAGLALSTVIALLAIVAFICVCKLNRELATKLRRLDTSSSPSTQDTESHYDLPWKQYGCRARMVPYTPTKPIENLVCVSPSDHSTTLDQSPFGVCLGTTHLYNTARDERYVAIRNACEDSGRDSI